MIRAKHYAATERLLETDPIIQDMAAELGKGAGLDLDAWAFIRQALQEYRRRGGAHPTHIGGPAAAIRHLVKGKP